MPPHIAMLPFPEEEQNAISLVLENLDALHQHVANFHLALELFDENCRHLHAAAPLATTVDEFVDYAQNRDEQRIHERRYHGRMNMAGREGGMQIHHIASALKNLGASKNSCPQFWAKIDSKFLGSASDMMKREFPQHTALRNAIAHEGEHTGTPEKRLANSISGEVDIEGFLYQSPSSQNNVITGRSGRVFYFNYQGDMIQYELSQASYDKLVAIRDMVASAFRKVSLP